MSVLISVVIPTRCRVETLKSSLKSAVDQDFDDYEIIVSDNKSEDGTKEVVESFGSPKIRYVNPQKRLSMCDNWEFALSHVQGDYVIFIGDDDAVMPGGLSKLAQHIKETNRADTYKWPAITYWWPIEGNLPWVTNFRIEMTKSRQSKGRQRIEVEDNLKSVALRTLKHGLWRYSDLPMSYHHAISTKIYRDIARESGRVFHSNAPDFVTYLEIPVFADTIVRLRDPITIFGISGKSNGGSSVAKDGKEVVAQFINEYGEYHFHPSLPSCLDPYWRLYMDPFFVSLDLFPSFYKDVEFNYSAMWAFMRRAGFIDRGFVYKNIDEIRKAHKFSIFTFEVYCLAHDLFDARRKLLNRPFGESRKIVSERDIYTYTHALAKELGAVI